VARSSKSTEFFSGLQVQKIADFFRVTRRTVDKWVSEDGCPKMEDGKHFDLHAVFEWYLKRETDKLAGTSLKDQKTEKEIERLTVQIAKINEKYIERSQHELEISSRAGALRNFLENSSQMNAYQFAGLGIEEVRTKLFDFVKEAMETWIHGTSS
jgi:phage terminase Nu1 subunit (DNA packaging protein)